jgi:hypothetical protein
MLALGGAARFGKIELAGVAAVEVPRARRA